MLKGTISRREVLSGIGIGAIGVALAACAPTPTPEESSEAAVGEAVPVSAGLEPADLDIWVWWPTPARTLNQMDPVFRELEPQVNVRAQAVSGYWDKLQTALAGGAGPDAFLMNNVNYYSWVNKGIALDLTPYVDASADTQDDLEHCQSVAVDFYKYNGKFYGLPNQIGVQTMVYNEDFLVEQGLTPLAEIEDEFTWDVWLDYATKCTVREGEDTSMWGTMSTQYIEYGAGCMAISNGGNFFNSDRSKCAFTEPESVEAWKLCTDMALEYEVSPSVQALSAENEISMFHTGRIAMMSLGNGFWEGLNEELDDFTYDMAIQPRAPRTNDSKCYSNIIALCVNNDAVAKDQAAAFVQFTITKRAVDMWSQNQLGVPVRPDAGAFFYDPDVFGPKNRIAALRMFENIEPLPSLDYVTWGEFITPFRQWEVEMFEGRVGVEEALESAAAEIDALIDKAKPA